MKWALFTIILFISFNSFSQKINWTTGDETYVKNYDVEQSADSINFIKLETISPTFNDTNYYAYTITEKNKWYRVKANMVSGIFLTDKLFSKNETPTIFINPSNQNLQLK